MKWLRRWTWGSMNVWLGAAVLLAACLVVARDRTTTYGTNPEIGASLSATSPIWPTGSFVLVRGGHLYVGNHPCTDPAWSDPTARCLRIWAKGVNNSTGVSQFQVHFTYPANMLTVSNGPGYGATTWLASTGRSASCTAWPNNTQGNQTFGCNTLGQVPPYGATGDGVLGSIAIESGDIVGPALIDFTNNTYLLDTPPNPDLQTTIPATVRSLSVYVAPCADNAPPPSGDGEITSADILYVVRKFDTSDPAADLNGDGTVTSADILIAVGEFGMFCSR